MRKDVKNKKRSGWQDRFITYTGSRLKKRHSLVDILFGIAIPILCLWLDPVVFRTTMMGGPYLNGLQMFAYLIISAGIGILIAYLFLPLKRHPTMGAVLGGLMLFGSLFALALGSVLLPLSILAVLANQMQGFLGLTPFLTAIVYFRAGLHALSTGWQKEKGAAIIACTILAISLLVGISALVQYRINIFISGAIADITFGEEYESILATEQLKNAFWCSDSLCYDYLVWAYHDWNLEHGSDAFWITNAYREITGREINERLWITGLHASLR